jgi:hypothetical protein
VLLHADIPDDLILEPPAGHLQAGWDAIPYKTASQHFGDEWLDGQASVVLKVPSVVVPVEFNYIINPLHPDVKRIRRSEPGSFTLDSHLGRICLPAGCYRQNLAVHLSGTRPHLFEFIFPAGAPIFGH